MDTHEIHFLVKVCPSVPFRGGRIYLSNRTKSKITLNGKILVCENETTMLSENDATQKVPQSI